ncbi:hypothetical protein MSAN_01995300 [Mycena sanguinolenta]|uniref:Uncharacterized protein n=1 Tax=Mycena sanguinolenta TaxID=230812 RepID=A0A8H6XKQ2_9AGAR|nr:hypothetical protein MSAN_01995300 [Mycena sanguinolenta]
MQPVGLGVVRPEAGCGWRTTIDYGLRGFDDAPSTVRNQRNHHSERGPCPPRSAAPLPAAQSHSSTDACSGFLAAPFLEFAAGYSGRARRGGPGATVTISIWSAPPLGICAQPQRSTSPHSPSCTPSHTLPLDWPRILSARLFTQWPSLAPSSRHRSRAAYSMVQSRRPCARLSSRRRRARHPPTHRRASRRSSFQPVIQADEHWWVRDRASLRRAGMLVRTPPLGTPRIGVRWRQRRSAAENRLYRLRAHVFVLDVAIIYHHPRALPHARPLLDLDFELSTPSALARSSSTPLSVIQSSPPSSSAACQSSTTSLRLMLIASPSRAPFRHLLGGMSVFNDLASSHAHRISVSSTFSASPPSLHRPPLLDAEFLHASRHFRTMSPYSSTPSPHRLCHRRRTSTPATLPARTSRCRFRAGGSQLHERSSRKGRTLDTCRTESVPRGAPSAGRWWMWSINEARSDADRVFAGVWRVAYRVIHGGMHGGIEYRPRRTACWWQCQQCSSWRSHCTSSSSPASTVFELMLSFSASLLSTTSTATSSISVLVFISASADVVDVPFSPSPSTTASPSSTASP